MLSVKQATKANKRAFERLTRAWGRGRGGIMELRQAWMRSSKRLVEAHERRHGGMFGLRGTIVRDD